MGNILRHGIEMYKQTINQKNELPVPQMENLYKSTSGELIKTVDNKESKIRRVAKFLILIGSEQAANILAELDPGLVEAISKEIAVIKVITPEERKEILSEFHSIFSKPYSFSGLSYGGVETARRILYAARGPEKGEAMLNKAVPETKENLFSFLEEFSPEQLVMLLKNEAAQTTALILSRLPDILSAET
jgi:flagellar motor switch protein FliG